MKLQTEYQLDLNYRVFSVSLAAEQRFTQFRDVFCSPFIPRWNEEAATLESFDYRVKLFVFPTKKREKYLYGPRLLSTFDTEGYTCRRVRDNLTDAQLKATDG